MRTEAFLAGHAVFSMDEAVHAFGRQTSRRAVLERLRYHVGQGRVQAVARGLYARVPSGVTADRFRPDPFLVAAAARPDGLFAHHSALELLGAAHSAWNTVTVYTETRRPPLLLEDTSIQFLSHPTPLVRAEQTAIGVRRLDRSGQRLHVTGPERALVEGFRSPEHVGGLDELIESAAGFPVLDLDLLWRVLEAFGEKSLYAAAGWFLERYQRTFHVPDPFLARLEGRRPRSPQYLVRRERGGRASARWNLIVPRPSSGGPSTR